MLGVTIFENRYWNFGTIYIFNTAKIEIMCFIPRFGYEIDHNIPITITTTTTKTITTTISKNIFTIIFFSGLFL